MRKDIEYNKAVDGKEAEEVSRLCSQILGISQSTRPDLAVSAIGKAFTVGLKALETMVRWSNGNLEGFADDTFKALRKEYDYLPEAPDELKAKEHRTVGFVPDNHVN